MAKKKPDGVVEAVHYKANGEIDWVRAYLRRGSIWSDYILVERDDLIQQLKSGKNYIIGKRVHKMAGTFEVSAPLRVVQAGEKDILVVGNSQAERDRLDGVPLI